MRDDWVPKALLYSELVVGKRNFGRPRLRYKDVCKRDLKHTCQKVWFNLYAFLFIPLITSFKNVDIDEWDRLTNDRNKWCLVIMERLSKRKKLFFKKPKKKTKKPE